MVSKFLSFGALATAFFSQYAYAQLADLASIIAEAGPPPTPTIAINVPSQVVKYDVISVESAAAAEQTSDPIAGDGAELKKRAACDAQIVGSGPVPSTDTAEAFVAFDQLSNMANNAATPAGYRNTFKNLKTMNNAMGYMGFTLLTSYDVAGCSRKCDAIDGCAAFNVAFERAPTKEPSAHEGSCPNPPSTTLVKCVFWGGPVTQANAVNDGQWRGDFHVVVAGSNGYINQTIDSPANFDGPNYLGSKAIYPSTFNDCNGDSVVTGLQFWNDGLPFDTRRCAAACTAQTSSDSANPCYFFNTFLATASSSGQTLGQVCVMYRRQYTESDGTVTQLSYNGDTYTFSWSYSYSDPSHTGLPCVVRPPPEECSNQGLDYAAYTNTQGVNNYPHHYVEFDPEFMKESRGGSSHVLSSGTISSLGIGGDPNGCSDTNVYQRTIYPGQPTVSCSYYAVNHRGYIKALVAGNYTFTMPPPDDVEFLWVGATAKQGWTKNNAVIRNSIGEYFDAGYNADATTKYYTQYLNAGEYLPFRVVLGNGQGPGGFSPSVKDPNGNVILEINSGFSRNVVRYSCDGAAAAFPYDIRGHEQ